MRTRPVVIACSLLTLGLPALASAQGGLPTGIRQRAIEIGAVGRYTIFPDEVEVDNLFAGGGRLGVYIWKNLAVEGEVSFGVANTTRRGVPDSTKDVSHTLWDGRLLYNTPQRGRTSFQLGAGYGYDGFGRLRPNGVGPRGHGPTGLVGLRFYLTPRVTLRGDVGGLYVTSEDEPRSQTSVVANKKNRFEPSVRLGLSALFRNSSAASEGMMMAGRVDTIRVTQVDTVYRERIQQAVQTPSSGAGMGAGGSTATVVVGVVNFDFDKADLSSDARRILDDIASSLTKPEAQRLRLILTGNTDAIGGESYNNRLSQRRAAAVAEYLATRGIGSDRIEQRAAGETNPVASNSNPEGRATRVSRRGGRRHTVEIALLALEGVVADTRRAWHDAVAHALADAGLAVPDSAGLPVADRDEARGAIEAAFRAARALAPAESRACRELDETAAELAWLRADRHFAARLAEGVTLHPGARDVVDRLASRLRLGLVSGLGRRETAFVLELAGLDAAFRAVVAAEDGRRPPPDPDRHARALARLARAAHRGPRADGAAPGVAVEGTAAGVRAARRAGLAVVGVGGSARRADDGAGPDAWVPGIAGLTYDSLIATLPHASARDR